jgi:hypothetical protein
MNRLLISIFILSLILISPFAIAAGKPPKPVDIPITQQISDTDVNSVPYMIQSDGLGNYTHTAITNKGKTTGTVSVLMENVCGGLYNGDRLLDQAAESVRKIKVTFDQNNAIQPGDPNYILPAQFFGTVNGTARFMNKCTCGAGQNMYTMPANTQIYCPMHIRMYSVNYRLDMGAAGETETEFVKIFCNAADSAGCKDWSIDPISNPGDTTNPGKTRGRLVDLGTNATLGNYYVTYHVHVTRP